nr:hypothetical protein [Rhodococcus sp. 06-418-1B]
MIEQHGQVLLDIVERCATHIHHGAFDCCQDRVREGFCGGLLDAVLDQRCCDRGSGGARDCGCPLGSLR